jgi:mono/diheme cytochrome c family protein
LFAKSSFIVKKRLPRHLRISANFSIFATRFETFMSPGGEYKYSNKNQGKPDNMPTQKKPFAFLTKAGITFLLSFILLSLSQVKVMAQDGEEIFENRCKICHELSTQAKVGPGLLGVTERRSREWLIQFIQNPQTLWDAGDKVALDLLKEYKGVKMTANTDLDTVKIGSIIDYIAAYDPNAGKKKVDLAATEYSHTDIQRGERLFRGLIPFQDSKIKCSSCHNVNTIDSLNWAPSVYDIALSLQADNKDLFKLLNKPSSTAMKGAHMNSKYTEEEVFYLKAYFHEVSEKGLEQSKRFPMKLMIFLGLGFLMTLALIDLFFTKLVKIRLIHALILIGGLSWQLKLVAHEAIDLGRTQNYAPDQPIKFSHAIHAGQNKIDCKYCHSDVDKGKTAGIPSANLCLNCHLVVREGKNSGHFEIDKIHRALANNKPIEWIKIHNLPDHVYFNHSQHVNAGKLECATCHGKVEEMHIVSQFSDLSMGWCVNCHRDTKVAQFNSNPYYGKYVDLHEKIKAGEMDSVSVEQIGGLDCMKCHY